MTTAKSPRRQGSACAGCAELRRGLDELRELIRSVARVAASGGGPRCACGRLATRRASTPHPWPANERPACDMCAPDASAELAAAPANRTVNTFLFDD